MGEYDDRRVEPKTVLVGTGMGVTPERLEEIERRRKELEKLSRPPPSESFDRVMARRRADAAAAPSHGEQKRRALPRKASRPSRASVVIKG